MASGHGVAKPDRGLHPGRQVSRVTGPGAQAFSVDPGLGAFERRLMAAQEVAKPDAMTRLDDPYTTLGDFTSRTGKVGERAVSLNTYRKAGNLRRSITADPIRRRGGMRQRSGGELEGYA